MQIIKNLVPHNGQDCHEAFRKYFIAVGYRSLGTKAMGSNWL